MIGYLLAGGAGAVIGGGLVYLYFMWALARASGM